MQIHTINPLDWEPGFPHPFPANVPEGIPEIPPDDEEEED